MSDAGVAFDKLSKIDRLALLETLGFYEPQRYQTREPIDLRYSNMHYEVQGELDRCYIKGRWVNR